MGKYVDKTTKQWRLLGLTYGRVEQWNIYDRKLHDLFGFIDYVLLVPNRGIDGVQICGGGHATHKTKILNEPRAKAWLLCSGGIDLFSWSKRKVKRGGKKEIWIPRVEEITIDMFERKE